MKIKDLEDWSKISKRKNKKKHQWGWFQNPNAGNVEYNIDFFNHVSGADGGDTSVLAGAVSDGGMGESVDSFNTENFTDSRNVGGDYMNDQVELYYDDLDVEAGFGGMDWDTGYPKHSYQTTVDYSLLVDRDDIIDDLLGMLPTKKDKLADEFNAITDDEEALAFIETNFDKLVDAYYYDLKDRHRDKAQEEAEEEFASNFDEDDYRYPERDYYDESVNIPKLLNGIDKRTDNKYDLLNLYECGVWDKDQKKYIAEMLVKRASPKALYSYMNEDIDIGDDEDWRIGLELYADNGKSYEVMTILEEREVDGHDLAIVGALGNEASNADEEAYFVLLDSDIEWGPVDTAEEAFEWASDVQDGYYDDLDDYYEYEEGWPDADDDVDWEDDTLEESETLKDSEYHQIDMTDPWGGTRSLIVKAFSFEEAKKKAEKFKPEWKFRAGYQASKDDVDSAKRRGLYVDSIDDAEEDDLYESSVGSLKGAYGRAKKAHMKNIARRNAATTYDEYDAADYAMNDTAAKVSRIEKKLRDRGVDPRSIPDSSEPDFFDLYGAHGEYDDDYRIQRRHAIEERMTPSGRRKMVSDRTMDRAVEAAKTVDPNARGDYDDDFIYGDDGHGGSTWAILLSGDGSVYSSGGDDTALLSKIEQAVNDAADAYWAELDRNWKEGMKRLNANGMKEGTVKQGKHWVNKGKAGTHGKFATKKAADAQRKAMFANGYNGEALEEDAARVEPLDRNQDVEKLVFNDINAQLETLRPSYDYRGYYDRLKSYAAWTNNRDYWYLEDNFDYHKGYASAKQNLILHYNGYGSVEKERLKAIAQAIKNIGGKYIAIKYGNVYFYLDLAKYIEKDRQAKHQAEEARKEKLMSIDIEKYRPSDALIAKAKQYYMTDSTRFVGKIDNIDTYLTYYYLATLLNWADLYDVVRNKAHSLGTYKYSDVEDAIDLKVKPEKIDRGNSGFVSNFRDVVKFCIDNKIQWKATSRRATSREYEKDTHNGAIYTIAYDFEVNGNVLPVAVHTDEGGGRPYGYMIDGTEVSGARQATALIIRWIKNVSNMED